MKTILTRPARKARRAGATVAALAALFTLLPAAPSALAASTAGTYNALLTPAGTPILDNTGLLTVSVTSTGAFTGRASMGGTSVSFRGELTTGGVARFRASDGTVIGTTLDLVDNSPSSFRGYLGALAFSIVSPTGLTGGITTQSSGGLSLATVAGTVAPYNTTTNPVPQSLLNQPVGTTFTKGVYTMALPSKAQGPVIPKTVYPQGAGIATVTVSTTGSVTVVGFLGDGAAYSVSSKLRADGTVPLYAPLYRKQGVIVGSVQLNPLATATDLSGSDFVWIRPALSQARFYKTGFNVLVDAIGTKYASPASLDFGQGAASSSLGNAKVAFTDGTLAAPVSKTVSVSPTTGSVSLVPASGSNHTLILTPSTGLFKGTLTHDGVTESYRGILLSKSASGAGYGQLLSPPALVYGASGQTSSVYLDPAGP